MTMNMKMAKIAAILWVLVVFGGLPAQAGPVTIELTTDALGLGSTEINRGGHNSPVLADKLNKLETNIDTSFPDIGSQLYIQSNGMAGKGATINPDTGLAGPLLVTVTARTHMDVDAPAYAEIHAGVITLTDKDNDLPNEGLGVRAFGIDLTGTLATNDNYGKRYVNSGYTATNAHGYGAQGSKEVSGGDWNEEYESPEIDQPWDNWVADQPLSGVPYNDPPHVDEDVTFTFNTAQYYVAADSVTVLLTKIRAGDDDLFDLALDLKINLVGGTSITKTYDYLSDDIDDSGTGFHGIFSLLPGYTDVIQVDFSGDSLGLVSTDMIESFIIGGRDDPADDPKETDEHFLINGFTADITVVPVPGAVLLGMLGLGVAGVKLRKYA